MKTKLNRRDFLAGSVLACAGGSLAAEDATPVASQASSKATLAVAPGSRGVLPTAKIGKLTLSRLVSGGNLISGWAHSRDLHYVPSLRRHYNT
jgi:nitrous oxide reductase